MKSAGVTSVMLIGLTSLVGSGVCQAAIGWDLPAVIHLDEVVPLPQPAGGSGEPGGYGKVSGTHVRRDDGVKAEEPLSVNYSRNLKEFQTLVEKIALSQQVTTQFSSAKCHGHLMPVMSTPATPLAAGAGAGHDCYVVSVGATGRLPPAKSSVKANGHQQKLGGGFSVPDLEGTLQAFHQPGASLLNALYLATKSLTSAQNLITNHGVDFAMVVLDRDPQCQQVYTHPQSIAQTMIGPGLMSLTKGQAEIATHMWTVGLKLSLYTQKYFNKGPPKLSPKHPNFKPTKRFLEGTPSVDYRGSYERMTTTLTNRYFRALPNTSCTPTSIKIATMCQPVTARVIYGKHGTVLSNQVYTLPDILLPKQSKGDPELFSSVVGCVDYNKPTK